VLRNPEIVDQADACYDNMYDGVYEVLERTLINGGRTRAKAPIRSMHESGQDHDTGHGFFF
jgi:hypothetical protein